MVDMFIHNQLYYMASLVSYLAHPGPPAGSRERKIFPKAKY